MRTSHTFGNVFVLSYCSFHAFHVAKSFNSVAEWIGVWKRERVCVCLSVWLSGGCSNSSTVLLHPSLNSDSRELCVIDSLSVKSSVWSLGEGQAPEELDKPIETPPLSTLLIEKPQSATVSVGELTIKRTSITNRCSWLQAENGSTSRCRGTFSRRHNCLRLCQLKQKENIPSILFTFTLVWRTKMSFGL